MFPSIECAEHSTFSMLTARHLTPTLRKYSLKFTFGRKGWDNAVPDTATEADVKHFIYGSASTPDSYGDDDEDEFGDDEEFGDEDDADDDADSDEEFEDDDEFDDDDDDQDDDEDEDDDD